MPLDATGAWVPDVQAPSAADYGAADPGAPSNLPLNPMAVDRSGVLDPNNPNSRPLVVSSTDPAYVPPGTPAPAPPALPPGAPAPMVAPAPAPMPTAAPAPSQAAPRAAGAPAFPPIAAADAEFKKGQEEQGKALDLQGKAEADKLDATAKAQRDEATLRENLAQQQAKTFKEQADHLEKVQNSVAADNARNFAEAKNRTIPAFFESRPGALTGSAISMALGGIASGILGGRNQAADVIEHNIDQYMKTEKDKIDVLFKYAEAKRGTNAEELAAMRDTYASRMLDLQSQHTELLKAAAARTLAVGNESGSQVAKANAAVLHAQLSDKANAQAQTNEELRVKQYNAKSERIKANASAEEARAKTIAATTGKADAEEEKVITANSHQHQKVADIARNRVDTNEGLVNALRDPNMSGGEVMQRLEQAMAVNQGEGKRGVSTASLHAVVPKLVSASGKFSDEASQLLTGKSGQAMRLSVLKLAQGGLDESRTEYARQGSDFEKANVSREYYKKHPEKLKEHRSQLYPDREAPAAPQAAPAAAHANGTQLYRHADGKLYPTP